MPYDPTKTPPAAALADQAAAEARRGLDPATRAELEQYRLQLDYYECRNRAHLARREAETEADFEARPKQYARLVRKAVRALAQAYRPGPSRRLEGPDAGGDAGALLELAYTSNHVNALLQRADRLATLQGACAVQAVPTGRPEKPAALYLWGRHEFVPYFADDDPMEPAAVVTKSVLRRPEGWLRRYQVWTDAEVRTFYTRPAKDVYEGFWGGTAADRFAADESGPHPYGVLPFAFFHNELPVEAFDGSGIGAPLAEANAEIDRMLSDTAEAIAVFSHPKLFGRNVSASVRWRDRTDGITILTPADQDGPPPEVVPLQAQLDVEQAWLHVERVANLTFEHLDVPLKAVRGDHGYEESGIKVLIDRGPLLDYLRERQASFSVYEERLKRVILAVVGGWYRIPAASAAADGVPLALSWPAPTFSVPTDEWDRSLQNGLAMGTESLVTVLQKREGLTEDQALERLGTIARHNRLAAQILGDADDAADTTDTTEGPDGMHLRQGGEEGRQEAPEEVTGDGRADHDDDDQAGAR